MYVKRRKADGGPPELQQSTNKAQEAKGNFSSITDIMEKFIYHMDQLDEKAKEIQQSSTSIDNSVDQLASVMEETTATIQQLEGMVDEQASRITVLTKAIEETNQIAATIEKAY